MTFMDVGFDDARDDGFDVVRRVSMEVDSRCHKIVAAVDDIVVGTRCASGWRFRPSLRRGPFEASTGRRSHDFIEDSL